MSDDLRTDPDDDALWSDDRIDIVAEPLRYARGPLIALVLIAIVPTIGLLVLNRWADETADEYEASGNASVLEADLRGAVVPESTVPGDDPVGAEDDTGSGTAPVLATGVLDYRRTPAPIAAEASAAELGRAVDPLLGFIGPESCASVAVDGVVATSSNPNLPVIPASNQKLLVALAALDVLGADHTFTTTVNAPPPSDGEIEGDIYLIGGGDPLLTSSDYPVAEFDSLPVTTPTPFESLADDLVAAGVTRVRGAVVGDGTRYDDEFVVPGWAEGIAYNDAGPYDALMVNDSRVAGNDGGESDPNEAAAQEFVRLLDDRGIQVDNGWTSGAAGPDVPVVATITSAPLSDVVIEMLLNSDNNTAEMLVKEIGVADSATGTRGAGLDAMVRSLEAQGVPLDGVVLRDGSGLSAANRVTCAAVLEVLQAGQGGPIDAGLPIAGVTGTLSDEFQDSPMLGRLRAKTGTLDNPPVEEDPPAVKALAGYVDPVAGPGPGTIQFVLIANSPDVTDVETYRGLWSVLGERLATYPAGPTTDSLGPR
ncbi:D-alanyl-D-alanine carboxypeptidase/D-alanyl-D-alanine endopeptidase [Ilumatobacter nonamiensis]|uniref:D-alanyl-D-alanine carboxypeptidase/D-alanyl-D-alanine endopeptidase n=1 Tax=Ilumatobacter nonamiensis TaxID=467093 RepID=UPI000345F654|nr:D-alanyl-D-alanine carboxypeptidase/D-alanyl-D-alanine-endopeptidase [Ilumatobacter nonamiensis]